VVSSSSPTGKLLRSAWHLIRLAFMQCNMAEQGERRCLNSSRKMLLLDLFSVSHHYSAHGGTVWFQTAYADTIDQEHRSCVHPSWCPALATYRKMGRMQVLYNFNLVDMDIRDFHIWLSRFCIAARVIALRREISESFELLSWVDKRAKIDEFFHYRNHLPLSCNCQWLIWCPELGLLSSIYCIN